MGQLGNTPPTLTVLRLEARKSFTLGVFITDPYGRYVDLTDCSLNIVAKREPYSTSDDSGNLFYDNPAATIEYPQDGYGRFDIQASQLDHPPGEYPFVIVLRARGYSSVIVKGVIEILANPEFTSADEDFEEVQAQQQINVLLQGTQVLRVAVGAVPPPGYRYIPEELLGRLEQLDTDGVAMLPPGGVPGYALVKVGTGDYEAEWRPQNQAVLPADGQPAGRVPVALGDGTWAWQPAPTGLRPDMDPTDAAANEILVADGNGGFYWEFFSNMETQPDWNNTSGGPGFIRNKPTLGSMASEESEDFVSMNTSLGQMSTVHITSTVPTSGTNGHIYFVYEA